MLLLVVLLLSLLKQGQGVALPFNASHVSIQHKHNTGSMMPHLQRCSEHIVGAHDRSAHERQVLDVRVDHVAVQVQPVLTRLQLQGHTAVQKQYSSTAGE